MPKLYLYSATLAACLCMSHQFSNWQWNWCLSKLSARIKNFLYCILEKNSTFLSSYFLTTKTLCTVSLVQVLIAIVTFTISLDLSHYSKKPSRVAVSFFQLVLQTFLTCLLFNLQQQCWDASVVVLQFINNIYSWSGKTRKMLFYLLLSLYVGQVKNVCQGKTIELVLC